MKITIRIQGGNVYNTCRRKNAEAPMYSWMWGGLEYSFARIRDGKLQIDMWY